ncbi:Mechanosensitive ion channel protein Msy1 [Cucumispora dikerogammari]|nr:Mechanosensitive ion channel protein Msy1 [Cucumispora dikerogammari]
MPHTSSSNRTDKNTGSDNKAESEVTESDSSSHFDSENDGLAFLSEYYISSSRNNRKKNRSPPSSPHMAGMSTNFEQATDFQPVSEVNLTGESLDNTTTTDNVNRENKESRNKTSILTKKIIILINNEFFVSLSISLMIFISSYLFKSVSFTLFQPGNTVKTEKIPLSFPNNVSNLKSKTYQLSNLIRNFSIVIIINKLISSLLKFLSTVAISKISVIVKRVYSNFTDKTISLVHPLNIAYYLRSCNETFTFFISLIFIYLYSYRGNNNEYIILGGMTVGDFIGTCIVISGICAVKSIVIGVLKREYEKNKGMKEKVGQHYMLNTLLTTQPPAISIINTQNTSVSSNSEKRTIFPASYRGTNSVQSRQGSTKGDNQASRANIDDIQANKDTASSDARDGECNKIENAKDSMVEGVSNSDLKLIDIEANSYLSFILQGVSTEATVFKGFIEHISEDDKVNTDILLGKHKAAFIVNTTYFAIENEISVLPQRKEVLRRPVSGESGGGDERERIYLRFKQSNSKIGANADELSEYDDDSGVDDEIRGIAATRNMSQSVTIIDSDTNLQDVIRDEIQKTVRVEPTNVLTQGAVKEISDTVGECKEDDKNDDQKYTSDGEQLSESRLTTLLLNDTSETVSIDKKESDSDKYQPGPGKPRTISADISDSTLVVQPSVVAVEQPSLESFDKSNILEEVGSSLVKTKKAEVYATNTPRSVPIPLKKKGSGTVSRIRKHKYNPDYHYFRTSSFKYKASLNYTNQLDPRITDSTFPLIHQLRILFQHKLDTCKKTNTEELTVYENTLLSAEFRKIYNLNYKSYNTEKKKREKAHKLAKKLSSLMTSSKCDNLEELIVLQTASLISGAKIHLHPLIKYPDFDRKIEAFCAKCHRLQLQVTNHPAALHLYSPLTFWISEYGNTKKDQLRNSLYEYITRYHNIIKSIDNMTEAIRRLDRFLWFIIIIYFVSVLFWKLFVDAKESFLGLITAVFGSSFVISGPAKSCIDSIIFLFCIHPYDVGDRILIDLSEDGSSTGATSKTSPASGSNALHEGLENLIVKRLNIFSTVFEKFDGTELIIYNNLLLNKMIYNIGRSEHLLEIHYLQITNTTDLNLLDGVKEKVRNYVKDNKWMNDLCMFNYDNLEKNKLWLKIIIDYKESCQDYLLYLKVRNGFVGFLNSVVVDYGLEYQENLQRVRVVK